LKALAKGKRQGYVPIVLGNESVLMACAKRLGLGLKIRKVTPPFEGIAPDDKLNLYDLSEVQHVEPGRPSPEGAREALGYVHRAVELLKTGHAHAMVTCPVSKAMISGAGARFLGHTGYIAEMLGSRDYRMMLLGPRLRVTLVTVHSPLKRIFEELSMDGIVATCRITHTALVADLGIPEPRIAVAGLNPHAGEGGLLGEEEDAIIRPAVLASRGEGMDVEGPFPADTIFFRAYHGEFDAVVAMYHDQGLIPLKLVHFREAVNWTIGLSIVRTSVDHGTAYEIAGKGIADPTSLENAILLASTIAKNRAKKRAWNHPTSG
jgi:4-hydroxythreonine-4-phosphate dehydrogenase